MNVLLVDDHAIVREGLRAILEREPDMRVVGEGADGAGAVAQAVALRPDVVVMDVSMAGLNGVEATRRILHALPRARVVALSMHVDRQYVYAMFEAGAAGYVPKNVASEELIRALRVVAAGGSYVSPAIVGVAVEALRGARPAAPGAALTAREREVLQLLAEGHTSKEIAERMRIALSTVETYRRHIMEKLDLRSIAALTKYAVRRGYTSVD